ncbi:hypothetical protein I79_012948 [Cricetulus griseus]|uniref:Uncharacterized protein n=1 Tax=Cricetulus griseus TaxID=10029 RepID=G3HQ54_CRIGR|nr:hypothetical protein I79_012948 [Cricetulus griseus]
MTAVVWLVTCCGFRRLATLRPRLQDITVALMACSYRKNTVDFASSFRTYVHAQSYPTDELVIQAICSAPVLS